MTGSRRPSVVVGISTFNRADILAKAIASAQAQSCRPLRVEVIDDASTDGTPLLRANFPGARWTRYTENRGYVAARNQIMLSASEDYYVSLDDDAWFLEGDEIALAVAYLESHPKVAAVAFDILSPDRPHPVSRGRRQDVCMYIGCGHVLRLSMVKALGGYESFPGNYGVEEKDLCLRIMDAGHDIVLLNGVHVWHDKTVTARDVSRQMRSGVCNDLTMTVWRFPGLLVAPALAWKLLANLRFALARRMLKPCLAGIGDFLKAWPAALRRRKPVRPASVSRFRALARHPRELAS